MSPMQNTVEGDEGRVQNCPALTHPHLATTLPNTAPAAITPIVSVFRGRGKITTVGVEKILQASALPPVTAKKAKIIMGCSIPQFSSPHEIKAFPL